MVNALVDVATSWLKRQPFDVEVEIGGQRFKGPVTPAQRDLLVAAIATQPGAEEPDNGVAH